MKELEKAIEQLKRENSKIKKVQNRAKQLNQKISKLKRSADTQRKVKKEECLKPLKEKLQEDIDNDLIYTFLDYVFLMTVK